MRLPVYCLFISLSLLELVQCAPNRSRRNNRRHSDDNDVHNLEVSLSQLESKLNTRVTAVEHKLSWKINDKIRKVNQTVEIAHLEHLLQVVNEELSISLDQGDRQRAEIASLLETINAQNSELTVVHNKLQHLEDIVLNLTNRIESSVTISDRANESERDFANDLSNHIRPPEYKSNYAKGLCLYIYGVLLVCRLRLISIRSLNGLICSRRPGKISGIWSARVHVRRFTPDVDRTLFAHGLNPSDRQ